MPKVVFYAKLGRCEKCGQQLYGISRKGGKACRGGKTFHMHRCSRKLMERINANLVDAGLLPRWVPVDNDDAEWMSQPSKMHAPKVIQRFRRVAKKLRRLDQAEWLLRGCLEQLRAMDCSAAHAVSWVRPRARTTLERVMILEEFLSEAVPQVEEKTCLPKKS